MAIARCGPAMKAEFVIPVGTLQAVFRMEIEEREREAPGGEQAFLRARAQKTIRFREPRRVAARLWG
jgi:hypothetical protein